MSLQKKVSVAGGMAQAVEYLSSKCKALSSSPSTTKKNIKKVFIESFFSICFLFFFCYEFREITRETPNVLPAK
jgi:predicted PurR-regulated permease PerM